MCRKLTLLVVCGIVLCGIAGLADGRESSSPLSRGQTTPLSSASRKRSKKLGSAKLRQDEQSGKEHRKKRKKKRRKIIDSGEKDTLSDDLSERSDLRSSEATRLSALVEDNVNELSTIATKTKVKRRRKKKVVQRRKLRPVSEDRDLPIDEIKTTPSTRKRKKKVKKKKSKRIRLHDDDSTKLEVEESEKGPKQDRDEDEALSPRLLKKRRKKRKRKAFSGSSSPGYGLDDLPALSTTENSANQHERAGSVVGEAIDQTKTSLEEDRKDPSTGSDKESESVDDGFLERMKVDIPPSEIEDVAIQSTSTKLEEVVDEPDEINALESIEQDSADSVHADKLPVDAGDDTYGSTVADKYTLGPEDIDAVPQTTDYVEIEPSGLVENQDASDSEPKEEKDGSADITCTAESTLGTTNNSTSVVVAESDDESSETEEAGDEMSGITQATPNDGAVNQIGITLDASNESTTEEEEEEEDDDDSSASEDDSVVEGGTSATVELDAIPSEEGATAESSQSETVSNFEATEHATGVTPLVDTNLGLQVDGLAEEEDDDEDSTTGDDEYSTAGDDDGDKTGRTPAASDSTVLNAVDSSNESSSKSMHDEVLTEKAFDQTTEEWVEANEAQINSTLNGVSPETEAVSDNLMNKELEKDVLKQLTPQTTLSQFNRTHNDLIVSAVTWNLAEASPSEEEAEFIRELCRGDKKSSLGNSDFVLIAGQECENIKPRRTEGHRSREFRRLAIQMLGKQYVPIALHMLGGIQFALFCKRKIIGEVQSAALVDVTCGIGNVFHNKGAIGCFVKLHPRKDCELPSRLLFVGAHMAAHVKNSDARDADFWRIMSELESQAPHWFMKPNRGNDISDGSRLQEVADFVVFCGDLNYRIDLPREEVETTIEQLASDTNDHSTRQRLLNFDQLRASISLEKAFPGFCEGEIKFMPTFKFDKGTADYDTSKKQRIPAWTDRILYKSKQTVEVVKYDSAPDSTHSDHRPVFGTFRIVAVPRPKREVKEATVKKKRRKRKRSDNRVLDD